jgi:hypothetical protein
MICSAAEKPKAESSTSGTPRQVETVETPRSASLTSVRADQSTPRKSIFGTIFFLRNAQHHHNRSLNGVEGEND